eukprot:TRINITY_DN3649_c0_g1_i6.p1 TRINITY_DN3649_c0_g1~~TRINITY_DN3649_c0_g1_i6.p1  ORF type:complete len:581 (+),score=165.95 TRINITY_DN3649_c0_g1_i6:131-1873(+)
MNKDIQNHTDVNAGSLHLNDTGGSCGYCGGKKGKSKGFRTWGLVSEKTRVDDYEVMIDRGWRRCGTYYYKTDLENSCCQLYTIRLKVTDFKLSHKQRKALNKFNRYLNGELDNKPQDTNPDKEETKHVKAEVAKSATLEKYEAVLQSIILKALAELLKKDKGKLKLAEEITLPKLKDKIQSRRPKDMAHGDIATNAALVLFNANRKLAKEATTLEEVQKAMVEKIAAACSEQKFKIVPAKNGFINFIAEFDLKAIIAQETPTPKAKPKPMKGDRDVKMKNLEEAKAPKECKKEEKKEQQYASYLRELIPNANPNPVHKYTIEIYPAIATEESLKVFQSYEKHIHGKPNKTMSSFKSFLCESPLYDPNNPEDVKRHTPINDTSKKFENQGIWPKFLGSYHMYHRIDGKLVAVGVLDFTPHVASSVYFFYDPDYKFLNLGVVGALREIEYISNIREKYSPGFEYYYLGYYIQDCVKSIYKGEYFPSYLLCPETYTWVPLEEVRKKIEEKGYARLAGEEVKMIEDMNFTKEAVLEVASKVAVLTSNEVISFSRFRNDFKKILMTIISKLGKGLIKNLVWTLDF